MKSSPATAESVFRGLLDAVAFIRNPANKADVMKAVAKGMRLPRVEDAEEGYHSMAGLYEKKIYPSVDGIRNVIRLLGMNNEKIRRLKAEDLIDDSVVRKLEKRRPVLNLTESKSAEDYANLYWILAAGVCRANVCFR